MNTIRVTHTTHSMSGWPGVAGNLNALSLPSAPATNNLDADGNMQTDGKFFGNFASANDLAAAISSTGLDTNVGMYDMKLLNTDGSVLR